MRRCIIFIESIEDDHVMILCPPRSMDKQRIPRSVIPEDLLIPEALVICFAAIEEYEDFEVSGPFEKAPEPWDFQEGGRHGFSRHLGLR